MLKSVWPNPNLYGINNNGHIYLVTDLFVYQYISDKHSLNTNCNINQKHTPTSNNNARKLENYTQQ